MIRNWKTLFLWYRKLYFCVGKLLVGSSIFRWYIIKPWIRSLAIDSVCSKDWSDNSLIWIFNNWTHMSEGTFPHISTYNLMQTIYGEVLPLQSNSDVFGLSRFLLTRLLNSPDIVEEYAHPTVPHLYKDGELICLFWFHCKRMLKWGTCMYLGCC